MNAEKLSKRLEKVASFIPHESRLVDIGSDHAYLPCYAVKAGIVNFAIAGEVVEGPYESAKHQVQQLRLENHIRVRLGSGLEVISRGEVNVITIAGMGGTLISSILEEGKEKLVGNERLILQPNVSAISIRKWLMKNGWAVVKEEILEEENKIYEIVVAEKGDSYQLTEKELLLGPILIKENNDIFKKKWQQECDQWKRILKEMEQAEETSELSIKKSEFRKKITMVEGVI
ncbi:tRNA (adenine(22)-N(1))-methyltransferase [Bacillus sp. 2205SS5-2]|uniref:tRNA (adenine(22)-N(1))-methyltransferase n=1 Tax=Bacillus sp. 2205SS5-2 TaxID=3109031 RepID=UPI003007368F